MKAPIDGSVGRNRKALARANTLRGRFVIAKRPYPYIPDAARRLALEKCLIFFLKRKNRFAWRRSEAGLFRATRANEVFPGVGACFR
ncbi:MAG TPA: hypothetical protein VG326_20065 [Tepidisphaeraceae bacterium]|jgi:hypothetical protein|nr:hypothetical protein [Tepidisphaeraceae bacterium]